MSTTVPDTKKIFIIGAGAWGTALAQATAIAGNEVTLFGRDAAVAREICSRHTNFRYLKEQMLSPRIYATTDIGALAQAELVVLAVPAQTTRKVIKAIPGGLKRGVPLIVTAKGFEKQTLALQSEIAAAHWPKSDILVLSGPSFAVDVAAGRPTALTLAANDPALAARVAPILASDSFRPYVSNDLRGVELAGGLKNVYALACGAVEGAGLGLSARSALIGRAHVEMSRLISNMGGKEQTMATLAGLGDLALSCTSTQSRNYHFGVELGRGQNIDQIMKAGIGLAEGVATAPVALELARKAGVDVPLIEAVNQLLAQKMKIAAIVSHLMRRPLKQEG
ncbi:Glycerol-3-phosphate dehydrogenase [NAD(P)+] [hydrothermal vent metagenome]|uniref:Glycerol-3-phosphate dehydrogenase [NAD(P)+] n=1 Tax=hydrothermal vent metagenome TaxID=652676 RepID=A0A3B0TKR7_9ZZZZ